MQDEVSQKTVAIQVQATKMTAKVFYKAIKSYMNHHANAKRAKTFDGPHGKMNMKELMRKGGGVTAVEVNDLKGFDKVARKYGIDYSVMKDKTVSPPKYTIFFKSRDLDAMKSAFKEFIKTARHPKPKITFHEKLKEALSKVAKVFKPKARHQERSR